jgi:hypothetical protein
MKEVSPPKAQFFIAVSLIALALLPCICPTSYLRVSPLAISAKAQQRAAFSIGNCEVCGDRAVRKFLKRSTARITESGNYIGYNPTKWPGNSEILLCEKHLRYADIAVGKRLTHAALFYLLVHGNNDWLRLVFLVHIFLLAGGAFFLFRWKTLKDEGSPVPNQPSERTR